MIATDFYNIFFDHFRCKAEDEESTLADLNMKLPYIPFRKVEETKHSTETQRDIGKMHSIKIFNALLSFRIPDWCQLVRS